jgi:hypothetical protein
LVSGEAAHPPPLYRRQPIANKTYYFEALVERTCTDTISVAVEADGPQQAKALAHKALLVYPSKVEGDEVKAILVENRDFRSSAVIDLARKVPTRDQQDS